MDWVRCSPGLAKAGWTASKIVKTTINKMLTINKVNSEVSLPTTIIGLNQNTFFSSNLKINLGYDEKNFFETLTPNFTIGLLWYFSVFVTVPVGLGYCWILE